MSDKNFFQELTERRFFRFAISYLVAGWAILQFVDWLVNRYGLATAWTDLFLFFLVAMLPGVLLYTWLHGRPGKDRVGIMGKLALPGNFLLAGLIAFFVFSSKPFVAAAQRVTVVDEEGEKLERMVPIKQFTSKLALFSLEKNTGNPDDDWLAHAVPFLLGADLEQDDRLQTTASFALADELLKYNHSLDSKAPFSIQRKIAGDVLATYFAVGELGKKDGNYTASIQFHETASGKKIGGGQYEAADLYRLVDQISLDFLDNIYLPDSKGKGMQKIVDLPADNLYSADLTALRFYQEGRIALKNNQHQAAIGAFQQAVAKDPSFAAAHLELGIAFYKMNATKEGREALEKAMSAMQGLPERQQFNIRYHFYVYTENYEKALALLAMWQQLYPTNETPWVLAIQLEMGRGEFAKAAEIGKKATEQGHEGRVLVLMAQLSSVQGKTEEAMSYYERFAELFPERAQEAAGLGFLYLESGEFEKAKTHLEKIQLLRPDDQETLIGLAKTEQHLGHFDKALQYYVSALKKAKTSRDSAGILYTMKDFKHALGQGKEAVSLLEQMTVANSKFMPPFRATQVYLSFNTILVFKEIGREKEALQIIENFLKTYPDPTGLLPCSGYLNYYIAVEDSANLRRKMAECEEPLRPHVGTGQLKMANGFLKKIEGDHASACQLLEEYFAESGLNVAHVAGLLGEVQMMKGDLDNAEKTLLAGLKLEPFSGPINLNLAILHEKKGNREKAKSFLQKALVTWANADAEYLPKQKAAKLAAEWAL